MPEITYDYDLEETLTVPEGAHGRVRHRRQAW
jgi:hypothetical protein